MDFRPHSRNFVRQVKREEGGDRVEAFLFCEDGDCLFQVNFAAFRPFHAKHEALSGLNPLFLGLFQANSAAFRPNSS